MIGFCRALDYSLGLTLCSGWKSGRCLSPAQLRSPSLLWAQPAAVLALESGRSHQDTEGGAEPRPSNPPSADPGGRQPPSAVGQLRGGFGPGSSTLLAHEQPLGKCGQVLVELETHYEQRTAFGDQKRELCLKGAICVDAVEWVTPRPF